MNPGEIYHIYNRGNNKGDIFFEEENYSYFLNRLQTYIIPYADVYAFCLMPNHFHLLVRIKNYPSVYFTQYTAKGMKRINPIEKAFKNFFISYVKSINSRYSRTGSLFESRYKRKLVDSDSYFNQVIAYIHYNPVEAGLAKDYLDWFYSSYHDFVLGKSLIVSLESVFSWFGEPYLFFEHHMQFSEFQKLKNQSL